MSVESRMSHYYGLYFLSIGSVMPFAALWFDSLKLSTAVSGVIFAAPSIAIVFFTVLIGGWADRLSDWRTAIIACNWIVLVLFSWFLVRTASWDILIIWTLAGLFTFASAPIMDAAALHLTRKRGSDYNRIRAIGSIGFVVGVLLAGVLFDKFGTRWFVYILLAGVIARIITAHALPHFRAPAESGNQSAKNHSAGNPAVDDPGIIHSQSSHQPHRRLEAPIAGIAALRHPGILLVIAGAALLNASHGFNNMFAVLHWTQQGISTTMASVLWSVGVIAEVALMWSFKSLAKKFSARKCLLLASVVGAVRWFLTGTDPKLTQLFALQCLHAITFGLTFLAGVNFISRRVHEDNAAQAQSVSVTLATLFMALTTLGSGWLYTQFAGQSYWAMSAVALLGGLFVALSFASDLDDSVHAQ